MAMTRAEREAYLAAVRRRLADLSSGPDLAVEELASFTTEELIAYLELFGVVLDEEQLDAEINAAMGTYLDDLDRGVPFDAAKQEELEKRIVAATDRAAVSVTRSTMRQMRATILEQEDTRDPADQLYMWHGRLRRPCRSCEERHGQIASIDTWRTVGLPGTGATPCGSNCECELQPVAATREVTRERVDAVNAQGPRRRILAAA